MTLWPVIKPLLVCDIFLKKIIRKRLAFIVMEELPDTVASSGYMLNSFGALLTDLASWVIEKFTQVMASFAPSFNTHNRNSMGTSVVFWIVTSFSIAKPSGEYSSLNRIRYRKENKSSFSPIKFSLKIYQWKFSSCFPNQPNGGFTLELEGELW